MLATQSNAKQRCRMFLKRFLYRSSESYLVKLILLEHNTMDGPGRNLMCIQCIHWTQFFTILSLLSSKRIANKILIINPISLYVYLKPMVLWLCVFKHVFVPTKVHRTHTYIRHRYSMYARKINENQNFMNVRTKIITFSQPTPATNEGILLEAVCLSTNVIVFLLLLQICYRQMVHL